MPQLDSTTFLPQLFWLAVTFIALYVVMRRLAVPQIWRALEARRQRLDSDLGRAAALKAEAEGVLAAYERALAGARAEAQTTLRQTAERMAAEAAERQRRLAASLAEQVAAAEARIAASKEAALGEIRGVAVDVGQAIVEKLIGTRPSAGRIDAAVEATLAGRAP
jgi:F-type H+-transporting ATPase subunit b